ncbi:stage II sporulation protein E [Bacillaceae bacterium S4-13-56]
MTEYVKPVEGQPWKERTIIQKTRWMNKIESTSRVLLIEKGWLLYVIGFLLGRALILTSISPFAIAFLASVWLIRKEKVGLTFIFTVLGGLSIGFDQAIWIGGSLFMMLLSIYFVRNLPIKQKHLPVLAFISSASVRGLWNYYGNHMTGYDWILTVAEATLSFVLVLIFMQSIPLLSPKRYRKTLKNEEIVSIIILLASVLTGLIGWSVMDASIEQVASRYLVLLFSLIGGAAIGSTVGVVAGLILSLSNVATLYQMSLLAFSGLLGGLLKEGKKIGVGIGLLVGTLLIGVYGDGGTHHIGTSMLESLFAVLIFLLTPHELIKKMARYIPGTAEHSKEQEQYIQKIRDVTANRVEQFSDVFNALSKSFTIEDPSLNQETIEREKDYFLSNVTEKTCQSCFMKEACWTRKFETTYGYMSEIMESLEEGTLGNQRKLMREFERHCVKPDKVIETMKHEMSFYQANKKLKKQVLESRKFVAEQLRGVSEVMEGFAKEIVKERKNHEVQEAEILRVLNDAGIELEQLDIFSLDPGNVDIEMVVSFYEYHGEGKKVIAPMLSDILDEMIILKNEEIAPFQGGDSHLSFGSAKAYTVDTGVSHAAKNGGFISGDSYTTMELGAGKYAVAISDGMGNGKRAHEESMETLYLLQRILHSGIEEKMAIKSINSILSLRTTDEIFSTLDLAVIDLQTAFTRFLKIGSTPSFIKRGDQIIKVEASNLPIGIIHEFEVDVVSEQLKAGDLLIQMSDGIFEGPKHVENVDMWLKRKIKDMETNDPQEVADLILEEVIRTKAGEIDDDMTVVVTKINHNNPEWSSIPVFNKIS